MQIGYARVSTLDQNSSMQLDALKRAGCKKILTDEGVSGKALKRPALTKVLKAVDAGDVLVVWRLDRLGRSLSHLIEVINGLAARKVGFRSLTESIDTTTAQGRLIFHMMGALAEFERGLRIERTRAGLAAAKRRGAKLGRRRSLTPAQVNHARKLIEAGERPASVADSIGVSRATLYRALAREVQ